MTKLPAIEKFLNHHTPLCTIHLYGEEPRTCSCGLMNACVEYETVTGLLKDLETMRETQRAYFATRNQNSLHAAKFWERRVDQALQLLNMPQKKKKEEATQETLPIIDAKKAGDE